jgi:hydroxybutyrate-dimer hydrolase
MPGRNDNENEEESMICTKPVLACLVLAVTASAASADNPLPSFVVPGSLEHMDYDGLTDDLLTAGLGASGLASAVAPAYANPANPTAAELRRNAIWNAYRGLVDMTPGGGYGVLWGPNLDANYHDTGSQGLVAGREYLVLTDDGTGSNFQTVMVQIPATFNTAAPCLITGPSSGSRNVYGAVGTSGEWAFRNGCAVAYTDKGTGNFYDDLTRGLIYDKHGLLGTQAAIGRLTNFAAPPAPGLAAYVAANPNRLAYKQAHAAKNVGARWGQYVLQSIEFGFFALNDYLGGGSIKFTPENTIVIAAGVSNGGGSVLLAAEQDSRHWIKGVVADEPNAQPRPSRDYTISFNGTVVADHSRSLVDYYTLIALYAPCASLASSLSGAVVQTFEPAGTPPGVPARANRCASLQAKGLLNSTTLADQASESLAIINNYGFLTEADILIPFMTYAGAYKQITNTYPSDAGRFRVEDHLCGMSFAATDTSFRPTPLATAVAANLFAAGNNLPPAGGINLINDRAVEGSILEQAGTSASTSRQDLNIDGDLCYRGLVAERHRDEDQRGWGGEFSGLAERVREGIEAQRASGDLGGRPAVILQGRSDEVLQPNSTGRAYYGLNQSTAHGNLVSYVEVTNAQHFDTAITDLSPGGVPIFVPLHHYFTKALDIMFAHLKSGGALPGSQVVHTTPRGTAAFTAANYTSFLPDMAITPSPANAITFSHDVLQIPE